MAASTTGLGVKPANAVRKSSSPGVLVHGAAPDGIEIKSGLIHGQEHESPYMFVYRKMEKIIERMQSDQDGVPVKTVKSFMSKIPSVCTGADLIQWILRRLEVEDINEAIHLANLMASHGYLFPIDDHILIVKNDNTYYRFQTPYFWPSNCLEPDNTDYAVYLCKRTMQNKTRLELADYEAENLARLQRTFSRKWEFIYMQAEAQIKVDKKRDKLERKIIDSQERAFWDVHRPPPGCVLTTEVDIKKSMRSKKTEADKAAAAPKEQGQKPSRRPSAVGTIPEVDEWRSLDNLKREVDFLRKRNERHTIRTSKVSESFLNYYEQYVEFDALMTPPEPSNPWIADNVEFWESEKTVRDIPSRRVRRWAFSIHELLLDPAGREHFTKFLEKEYSGENLRFWDACNELKSVSQKRLQQRIREIYSEFLAPGAPCPVNVDSRVMSVVKANLENPDRYVFSDAQEHIFNLMSRDSYQRFLRSDTYKDILAGAKKKVGPARK